MRYMVMHYQTQAMEDGEVPSAEEQAAIGEYMREAAMSGVLLSGEGVASSSKGARVEVHDGATRVIDFGQLTGGALQGKGTFTLHVCSEKR